MNIFKLLCQKCGRINDQTYRVSQKISLFNGKFFLAIKNYKFSCKMSIFCPMGLKDGDFCFDQCQCRWFSGLKSHISLRRVLSTSFIERLKRQPPCMQIAYSYDLKSKFTIKHYLLNTNNSSWHLFYQGLYGLFYNFIIFMHVNQYRQ